MTAVPDDVSFESAPTWTPDVLLDGYEAMPLGGATLVRSTRRPATPRGVVVHVHGYNDYFFQTHLARAVTAAGFVSYAVDLRRSGRSLLRPMPVPAGAGAPLPAHFATSLREFGADIDAAMAAVRAGEPGLPVVVHAHSTGGLTSSLWAHARRADVTLAPDALVLNSPFLDMTGSWLSRQLSTGALQVLGRLRPLAVLSTHPSVYATYQHADNGGRWDFDTRLKKPGGQPARAAWLRTVRRGQARLAEGLEIRCPVLFARSATSGPDSPDNPDLDAQDTVLDVTALARMAPRLGSDVTELIVDGGVHDLTLSAERPRSTYLDAMTQFLVDRLAAGDR